MDYKMYIWNNFRYGTLVIHCLHFLQELKKIKINKGFLSRKDITVITEPLKVTLRCFFYIHQETIC